MTTPETAPPSGDQKPNITVEYDGAYHALEPDAPFEIGREGDLSVDDNPYLHRRLLLIEREGDYWWLTNVGSRIAATITDTDTGMQAWLPPGGRTPLIFKTTTVVFTAGPITYEIAIHNDAPTFNAPAGRAANLSGATTVGSIPLTLSQRQLIVALAEPMLRHGTSGASQMPSNADAARRLGWAVSRFNRKLDNVCDKLDRFGVEGVRGGPGSLATGRRARLVEYAVATGLVTSVDLQLLDQEAPEEGDDE
ncbi:MAG: hypothetical protein LBR27_08585 [Bifidobacteriaceae bacterium]|jgi:hypothetical protein|nr:hypothetical protein [Bifidobacteriaceae bacterium]